MPRLVLALLLVTGCISWKPSGMGPMQPSNPEVAAPAGADEAVYLAIAEWVRRAGPPAPAYGWLLPKVRWFKGIETAETGCCHLEYDGGRRYDSIVWPREAALHVVTVTPENRPSGSGLAHELLHWTLRASGRDSDPGHKNKALWSQTREVNALLKERGL